MKGIDLILRVRSSLEPIPFTCIYGVPRSWYFLWPWQQASSDFGLQLQLPNPQAGLYCLPSISFTNIFETKDRPSYRSSVPSSMRLTWPSQRTCYNSLPPLLGHPSLAHGLARWCWNSFWGSTGGFQTLRNTSNNTQKHATGCANGRNGTSNNVGSCWQTMLRPIARGLQCTKCLTNRSGRSWTTLWIHWG